MSHFPDASCSLLLSPLHPPIVPLLLTHELTMDIDGPSSPPLRDTSLPHSSAPMPTPSSPGRSQATPRRNRQQSDVFDVPDDEAVEDNGAQPTRRRGRPRNQINADVPIVKDSVGEYLQETFETFLRTYVISHCYTRPFSHTLYQIYRRDQPYAYTGFGWWCPLGPRW